jgi:cysteine-rich repeat protein
VGSRARALLIVVVVGAGCPGDDASSVDDTSGTAGESSAADTSASSTSDASSSDASDPDESSGTTGVAICGDGSTDGDEVCDDANLVDGDGCSADCSSATCLVPVTHATIQVALDDAGCPTVFVGSDHYHEFLEIERDVEVVRSGPTAPVIDAMHLGRAIDIAADVVVVLRGIEVARGSADHGGGIRSSGTLELEDVVVRDSRVEGVMPCGGGVWTDGTLVAIASTIRDNECVLPLETGTAAGGGICVTSGELQLRDGTVVSGNVARASGPGSVAAEGGGLFLGNIVAQIENDVVLTGNRVEIDGIVSNVLARGGAVRQLGGTLTLVDSIVEGNSVLLDGVADPGNALIAEGGGLALLAVDATVTSSTIANNVASATGQGELVARGGGVRASGFSTLSFTDTGIVDNAATTTSTTRDDEGTAAGGGVFLTLISGDPENGMFVRFDRSALTGNVAEGQSLAQGGGIFVSASVDEARVELDVVNSTLGENSADTRGGGIAATCEDGTTIAITLRSATVSACSSSLGAGLWIDPDAGIVTVDLANTALVGNEGDPTPDCWPAEATLTSSGSNAFGELACMVAGGVGDLVGEDPMFEVLAENGGPTPTFALDPASPLRNAGDPAGCVDADGAVLASDQRGEDRHAEGVCDVGAFELLP